MAIELSYERFNDGDDIVPWYSTEEVILNICSIVPQLRHNYKLGCIIPMN
jgi:hypothetical protein